MKTTFWMLLFVTALSLGSLQAAPLFAQCPPVGLNTGCEFLITVNADSSVTITADPNIPNNVPYGGDDDSLIGVLNNSSKSVSSLFLTSGLDLFNFDGDGPCTQTPGPSNCSADPSGYGGPGVTFSNIAANFTSGNVNFAGGIASGGSAWFAVEPALSLGDFTASAGGTASGIPEPSTNLLLGGGLAGLFALYRRKSA